MGFDQTHSTGDVRRRFLEAAARGLNRCANAVAATAVQEAPLGPAASAPKGVGGEGHSGGGGTGELRASALYPLVDAGHSATATNLSAMVSFNTIYAAAQHEGFAIQDRNGQEVLWVVKKYTTPGTKKKFLEDPVKAIAATQQDRLIAEEVAKEFS